MAKKTLTIKDIAEKVISFDVDYDKLAHMSAKFKNFNYETTLSVPLSVNATKNFIEFMQSGKTICETLVMPDFYTLAAYFECDKLKKSFTDQIMNMLPEDIVKMYVEHASNVPLTNALVIAAMKNITSQQITKNMPYDMLVKILASPDYEKDWKQPKLESVLFSTMMVWFVTHCDVNTVTDDSRKKFLECWNLIHVNCLEPLVLNKLAESHYFKDPEICSKIAPQMVKQYAAISNGVRVPPQRWKLLEEKREREKLQSLTLTQDQLCALEIGDVVDVLDSHNSWYLAKVTDICDEHIEVSFEGWSASYDEKIPRNSNRIAKKGAHTNGVDHNGQSDCGCNSCLMRRSRGGIGGIPVDISSLESIMRGIMGGSLRF